MSSTNPEEGVPVQNETGQVDEFSTATATMEMEAPTESVQESGLESSQIDPQLETVQHVLRLWLNWNQTHEQLTAKMFEVGHNSAKTEDLMHQADELRREAVSVSEQLLGY